MVILKIKKPGYVVNIPGTPTFRTPAEIDISKIDLRIITMYLKNSDINDYEIITEKNDIKESYKKKNVDDKIKDNINWEKRFNRIEDILNNLISAPRNNNNSEEQIINKIQNLENIISKNLIKTDSKFIINNEPIIEEIGSFIPNIDTSNMKINSYENIQKIKQDDGLENSANLLAELMKK